MASHEHYMQAAITEALKGQGRTYPNPSVGCVIVHQGAVVASGYHHRAGEPHAEIMAFRQFDALDVDPKECDLYVTLEPCCIHGRTPPCTQAILDRGFPRVFIGSTDPNPRVDGGGIDQLSARGVEVHHGILSAQTDNVIAAFAKRMLTGLPLVSLKYAMTLDGKLATSTGHSAWITNATSREHVHVLRDQHDAILVGTGTLLTDNPKLTCRLPHGRSPAKILLDARLKVSPDALVFDQPELDHTPIHLFTSEHAPTSRHQPFIDRGAQVHVLETDDAQRFVLESVLRAVAALGYTSVLVEGGAQIHGALLDAQLADQVYAYIAPSLIGGADAPGPVGGQGIPLANEAVRLEILSTRQFDGDLFIHGKVPKHRRAYPIPQF